MRESPDTNVDATRLRPRFSVELPVAALQQNVKVEVRSGDLGQRIIR